jgi:hypothetical protein
VRLTEEVMTQLKEAVLSTGLVINKNKILEKKQNLMNLEQDLITDGKIFEGFQNFRY